MPGSLQRHRWFGVAVLFSALLAPFAAQAQSDGGAQDASVPAYSTIADALEDETARKALIAELRALAAEQEAAGASDAAEPADAAASAPDEPEPSVSRRFAALTQQVAEGLAREFSEAVAAFSSVGSDTASVDWPALARASVDLVAVIIAVLVVYFVLRRICTPIYRRLDGWSQRPAASALLRKVSAVGVAAGIDGVLIVLAWVAGFALALFGLSEPGAMDARQTMFLNAFLLVEAFKALIRMLFATRFDGLRLLPMSADAAAYWNGWFARLSGFIGYGLLLVVPVVNVNVSPEAGRALTLVVMVLAFVYAAAVILRNRDRVRDQLQHYAAGAQLGVGRVALHALARIWHLLALTYFASLAVVAILRPEDALPFLLRASVQTLIAVGGGVFVAIVMAQIISRRIRLPDEVNRKFPLLETRLNGAVPSALHVLRGVILLAVGLVILDAWAAFNLPEWLGSDAGTAFLVTLISVGFVLLIAKAVWIGFASWVELRLNPDSDRGAPSAREETLLALFRSAFLIVLTVLTAMIVLSEIGINIGPLIAGAGVLGLAIGFGAQKLVQDVITGVFIQLENAINTGDVVTAGPVTGTAEKLTVRSVGIRDLSGTYHIVPFSSVDTVSNFMRDFAYHVGVYGVAYREDIDEVMIQLRKAFDALMADAGQAPKVLEPLELHGVTELADSSVNIRVRIKTTPGNQWAIGREYNKLVKQHFDAAGIEIPFPHTTLYFGEDRSGDAPAANVRMLEARDVTPRGGDDAPAARRRVEQNPTELGDFDEDGG